MNEDDDNEDDDILICPSCDEEYRISDCDNIHYFNEDRPRCPACQEQELLEDQTCEYCDQPAVERTSNGFLCEDHYDDYCDGYKRDD